jgi:hypothetical protein
MCGKGLEKAGLVFKVWRMARIALPEIEKVLETPELPELGSGPRAGVQSEAALNRTMDGLLAETKLKQEKQQLIRALVLLWHDHLEAAHGIAQEIENADGAFVHGIMHRREPDYGNAAYWFRRVGRHPAFPEIGKRTSALLEEGERELLQKLIPRGEWDAFAFIDACEKCAGKGGSETRKQILKEVQEVETRALLDWFCK